MQKTGEYLHQKYVRLSLNISSLNENLKKNRKGYLFSESFFWKNNKQKRLFEDYSQVIEIFLISVYFLAFFLLFKQISVWQSGDSKKVQWPAKQNLIHFTDFTGLLALGRLHHQTQVSI